MTKIEIKILKIIALIGFVYGSLFYPFYTEFLEFGQTLSGKVPIYEFNHL